MKLFEINEVLPILPSGEWFLRINPLLTFLIEASIPLLLISRHTRISGILLGFVFHFAVGLKHTGFTLLMFSLYSLFLPDQFFQLIGNNIIKVKTRLSGLNINRNKYIYLISRLVLIIVIIKFISFMMGGAGINTFILSREGFYLISFSIFFILFTYYLVKYLINTHKIESISFVPRQLAVILLPLVLFLYGLFPYTGVKNIQVFTMFSNLSTEYGKTNHFFIPTSIQIFDNLSDLVHIKSSSLGGLDKFSGPVGTFPLNQTHILLPKSYIEYLEPSGKDVYEKFQYAIPFKLLSNIITEVSERGVKNIEIEYVRSGKNYITKNAENDPELSAASLLQRKLLGLRAVPVSKQGVCMW